MISCMGGNCVSRGRCANYHYCGGDPVERLCGDEEEIDAIDRTMEAHSPTRDKIWNMDDIRSGIGGSDLVSSVA